VAAWWPRERGPGLFEPALPLGVDKLAAAFNEFAQGVSLGARDGELGLKLGVNCLVVEDNGVGVLAWLASGVGERMDRGWHSGNLQGRYSRPDKDLTRVLGGPSLAEA
jgi:hypothetical protein